MISKSKSYITDGDNTTKRYSLNGQKRFNALRKVLKGFPRSEKFKTRKEIDEYLSGDRIQCLLCGKSYKSLGTHLKRIEGITVDQYKERYGLPWGKGLVCNETSKKCSRNTLKRIADGSLKIGTDNMTDIEKKKLWESAKTQRKHCPANKKYNTEKSRKALEDYNKKKPKKYKRTPDSVINAEIRVIRDRDIVDLFIGGKGVMEITRSKNIAKKTVLSCLKRNNLAKSREQMNNDANKLKERVFELRRQGVKLKDIAKQINRTQCRVTQILSKKEAACVN